MAREIKGRIFLVGCPRSGTTLLQSLLAAHPQIESFPETHLFVSTGRSLRSKVLRRLGFVSPEMHNQLINFLKRIGQEQLCSLLPRHPFLLKDYTRAFNEILDLLTIRKDKSVWAEKTPAHLHYIGEIKQYFPNARFVHIIRSGQEVVASLYEATHKFPHGWDGAYEIDRCINRWNMDIKLSHKCLNQNKHFVVWYDDLVGETEKVLERVCDFIGVEMSRNMLINYRFEVNGLIFPEELWKNRVKEGIRHSEQEKFRHIFTPVQQQYILNRLDEIPKEMIQASHRCCSFGR